MWPLSDGSFISLPAHASYQEQPNYLTSLNGCRQEKLGFPLFKPLFYLQSNHESKLKVLSFFSAIPYTLSNREYVQWVQRCLQTRPKTKQNKKHHKKFQDCAQFGIIGCFSINVLLILNWIGHTPQDDELKSQEVEFTEGKWTLGNAVFTINLHEFNHIIKNVYT